MQEDDHSQYRPNCRCNSVRGHFFSFLAHSPEAHNHPQTIPLCHGEDLLLTIREEGSIGGGMEGGGILSSPVKHLGLALR